MIGSAEQRTPGSLPTDVRCSSPKQLTENGAQWEELWCIFGISHSFPRSLYFLNGLKHLL